MKFDFNRKVLKNGMTIIFEKREVPVVSVAFAVRNGGINESSDEKGMSHFIEHMLYKGTSSRNYKQIAEEIEKNGGILNGFTSELITAFYCKIPSKHIDKALDVLSDIIKNSSFDESEFEKERKVIFEELKKRKDNPQIYVLDKIQELLYDEPLGKMDSQETMNSITRKTLFKSFKEIYTPNNLIMCVVGDANFDKLVNFAEKNFNDDMGKTKSFKINLKNKSKIEKRKGIDQANLVFAYHTPLIEDKRSYAGLILNKILTGGMSSRLFIEIREKRNLAYSINGYCDINKNFSYGVIYVGTAKDKLDEVKELILKEFKGVSENLREEELGQIKEQAIGNYFIDMEDSETQMSHLLQSEVNGNAGNFYEFEKNIKAVKLEDVKKLASKVNEKKYSFFALVPDD